MGFDVTPIDVPEEYQTAFRRLRRRIPLELQRDNDLLALLLLYLKFGGERLALQRLDALLKPAEKEFIIVKRRSDDELDEDDSEDDEENEDEESDDLDEEESDDDDDHD